MINKTFRRLALGAAAVTVAGVVVPVALASAANAAEATGITASPTAAGSNVVAPGTTATYSATLTPAGSTATGIYYAVTGGPSHTSLAGTACPNNTPPAAPAASNSGSGTFTCSVGTTGFTPGTYTVTIFDNTAGSTNFQNSDPNTTVSLIVQGAVAQTTITPTTSHAATATCVGYTVTGKDASGNPATGNDTVTITQTTTGTAPGTDPNLRFCDPTVTDFPAAAVGAAATNTTGDTYSASQTITYSGGKATVGVASDFPGTVTVMAGTNSGSTNGQSATQTVSKGNTDNSGSSTNNDNATTITLTPGNANAFAGTALTETATVTNSAGDPLGGVSVDYVINNSTTAFTACTAETGQTGDVTNQAGQIVCTFTPPAAGTYTLTAYTNTDKNSPNTNFPDANDPKTSATITATTEPSFNTPTHNCAGALTPTGATCTVPASQATEVVTFTFTQDNSASGGSATAPSANQAVNFSTTSNNPGVSISPKSATTNAQGQVQVTVTHNAGTDETIPVTATLAGDSGVTNSVNVHFQTSSATSGSLSLAPQNQTKTVGSQVTVTATAADQFGAPVSGDVISFTVLGPRNTTANNAGATGTCTTGSNGSCNFTYTDKGGALTGTATEYDQIHATDTKTSISTSTDAAHASNAPGGSSPTSDATVTFVAGTATAANVALAAAHTTYATSPTGSVPATGFDTVSATVTDQYGNALANDTVTFTSTGAGGFVDAQGNSLGTTTTAQTNGNGVATVNVSSSTPGQQTVSSSADGVQSNPVTITYSNSSYNPVPPERILDTRTGQGAISTSIIFGGPASPGALAPNTIYYFNLGNTNVPLNQDAYVFNVTAIGPSGLGNLRISPVECQGGGGGLPSGVVPTTSLINYQPGQDSANSIVIPDVGNCIANEFEIYSAGASANVAIDLQGFYPASGNQEFKGMTPTRVADTRNSGGPVAANSSQTFQISGPAQIPAGSKAVALNVTAIGPTGLGNLRIYPDGSSVPSTSNINYIPGVDKAAFVVIQLPADGKIDVYSAGSPVNVAIDVFGFYPSTATVVTQAPVRVFDSRTGNGTELKAGVPVDVPVTAPNVTNGVPANAQAVLVSLTAIHAADSTGIGNLRAYPTGEATPTVSNINYVGPNWDVANFAIVPIGANGKITLYSAGSNVNATVDILGYVPAAS